MPDYTDVEKLQLIQSLDPNASIQASVGTAWNAKSPFDVHFYLNSKIDIKDGGLLKSLSGHSDSPEGAVRNCFDELTQQVSAADRQYIVVNERYASDRKAYVWSGVCFTQIVEDI